VVPRGLGAPTPPSLSRMFVSSTLLLLTLEVRLEDKPPSQPLPPPPSTFGGNGVVSGVVVSLFVFRGVPQ